jgi:outer membrane lipoprotein-sorting protein
VIGRFPPWRIASAIVVMILLGACAVAFTLHGSPVARFTADRLKSDPPRRSADRGLRPSSSPEARRLLTQAAAAADDVSYSGIQVSDWWGPAGMSSSQLDVWHRPGAGIVARTLAPPEDGTDTQLYSPGSGDPVVAMAMSVRQVDLLLENYDVKYTGAGSAGGRSAQVISVVRPGGRLAARFWLDEATKLPLRRELFDADTHLVSDIRLIDLKIGASAVAEMPAAQAQPWTRQLGARAIRLLQGKGWPVPPRLAGGLRLFAASEAVNSAGLVVDTSYSDGLSVISLFVERGHLPKVMGGWLELKLDGHRVFSSDPDDRSIAWGSGGFVFTMISDAPVSTVREAFAAALADSRSPDFWVRLGRGFKRLASLANLFR